MLLRAFRYGGFVRGAAYPLEARKEARAMGCTRLACAVFVRAEIARRTLDPYGSRRCQVCHLGCRAVRVCEGAGGKRVRICPLYTQMDLG